MTYNMYRYIFIGGLVLALLMLAAAIFIFFFLKIKNVIGDLTGSNARKAIENIRNQSVSTPANHKKKIDPAKQTPSARLAAESVATTKISPQDRYDSMDAAETTTLNDVQSSETTVLSQEVEKPVAVPVAVHEEKVFDYTNFSVEVDITYVHSNEVIR